MTAFDRAAQTVDRRKRLRQRGVRMELRFVA